MLLIREVFHCRPGKVRALLEKFQAMNRIMANAGQGNMRLMTDFSGERYWTLVAEFETPGMAEFEKMMQGGGMNEADTKEFERLMDQRWERILLQPLRCPVLDEHLQGSELLSQAILSPPRHGAGSGRARLRSARPKGMGLFWQRYG